MFKLSSGIGIHVQIAEPSIQLDFYFEIFVRRVPLARYFLLVTWSLFLESNTLQGDVKEFDILCTIFCL